MQDEQHSLVHDVVTRWNRTYFLIERLLDQRWPVLSDPSVTKCSDCSLDLTSEQWNLLAELKPVLHVLQIATTFLSGEYNVSISALQPIVHGFTRSMEVTEEDSPAIRQCKCAISKELRSSLISLILSVLAVIWWLYAWFKLNSLSLISV